MSAGQFEEGKYGQDNGTNIWACRVQPETKSLTLGSVANDYPAGNLTADLPTLEISNRGKRGFGLKPRYVTIELTANGTAETGDYQGAGTRHDVPVFQKTVFDGYAKGQTGTYLGIACVFRSKTPEQLV